MSEQNKPKDDNAAASGELTEDQLEAVSGGTFVVSGGARRGTLGSILG